MSKFKVGDKVKVKKGHCDGSWDGFIGTVEENVHPKSFYISVFMPQTNIKNCLFTADEIELVEEQ